MKDDLIEQLVREADRRQPAPPATHPAAMAGAVLERSRRRARRTRAGLVIALGVSLIAALVTMQTSSSTSTHVALGSGAAVAKMQLADVRARAASQEQRIHRMLTLEQRLRAPAPSDAPVTTDDPIERAAAVVVLQADRVRDTPGLAHEALESYQRVIEHFPQTASADLARRRAAELRKEG